MGTANRCKPRHRRPRRPRSKRSSCAIPLGQRHSEFGTRYYDPSVGRWTQLDPSGLDDHYVYAAADPVNFVDPSGLLPFSCEHAGDRECSDLDYEAIIDCAYNIGNAITGAADVVTGLAVAIAAAGASPLTAAIGTPAGLGFAMFSADQTMDAANQSINCLGL